MKLTITNDLDGIVIREILKDKIKFSNATITFLKTRDRGIVLNGERVTVRKAVKTGDILEVLTPHQKKEPVIFYILQGLRRRNHSI